MSTKSKRKAHCPALDGLRAQVEYLYCAKKYSVRRLRDDLNKQHGLDALWVAPLIVGTGHSRFLVMAHMAIIRLQIQHIPNFACLVQIFPVPKQDIRLGLPEELDKRPSGSDQAKASNDRSKISQAVISRSGSGAYAVIVSPDNLQRKIRRREQATSTIQEDYSHLCVSSRM